MLIAGLAKLAELVKKYAAPMYAPTAAAADPIRLVRASEKITNNSPKVATTSASRWAGLARWWVEMLTAASANIALASTAPSAHPAIWAGTYPSRSRRATPPKAESTSETAGLK